MYESRINENGNIETLFHTAKCHDLLNDTWTDIARTTDIADCCDAVRRFRDDMDAVGWSEDDGDYEIIRDCEWGRRRRRRRRLITHGGRKASAYKETKSHVCLYEEELDAPCAP